MSKIVRIVMLLALVAGVAAAAGRPRDPQRKSHVYLEQCVFHQVTPGGLVDTPFQALVAWDGNKFGVVGSFGVFDLDLDAAPGSSPAAPVIYEWADDSTCTGNKHRLECSATEHVFFTVPGFEDFVGPFSWTYTTLPDDELNVFNSQDPAGNGATCFNELVDRATCLEAVAAMRTFFATKGGHGTVDLTDGLCD